METQFIRSEILLGKKSTESLNSSGVIIFGLGGVGGTLCEFLARAGIGKFLLIDHDRVSLSNINRQVVALHSTLSQYKTDVMAARIWDIYPAAKVETRRVFITPDNINDIDFSAYDYVADAVDTVSAKIAIIKKAKESDKEIISCMGAGNRLSANFRAVDIAETYGCPLAKKIRAELKKLGICGVKAVFSPDSADIFKGEEFIGSLPFIPPAAGLCMAGEIIKKLAQPKGRDIS